VQSRKCKGQHGTLSRC